MTMVGVRELKTYLSRYLRRVRDGESLLITDHGKGIATLTAITESRIRSKVLKLAQEGKLDWDGGKPTGLKNRVPCRGKPASKSIREDRADRV